MPYITQLYCNVIILPTEDWTNLYMNTKSKKLGFINIKTPANLQKEANYNKNQHIYFLSKREIPINGYGWHEVIPDEIHKMEFGFKDPENYNQLYKVEASTDASLGLPVISESFIKDYSQHSESMSKIIVELWDDVLNISKIYYHFKQ